MGLLDQIAKGSNFDPFGSYQRGKQIKQQRETHAAQQKSRSLIDELRQAQLGQIDKQNQATLDAAEQQKQFQTLTESYLQGDEQAGQQLKTTQIGRKILTDLNALEPEEKARLLTPDETTQHGFNPGAVVQQGPQGKFNVLQQGQAAQTPQQQQQQAFEQQKFEALNADRQADNARADRKLDMQQQVQQQKAAQGPKLSAAAQKTASFVGRMEKANTILDALEADPDFDPTNIRKGPFTSNKIRQYDQAAREWAMAVLRDESGAAISDKEIDNAMKTYFPSFGDNNLFSNTGPVIKQKAAARKAQEEALRQRAMITQVEEETELEMLLRRKAELEAQQNAGQ